MLPTEKISVGDGPQPDCVYDVRLDSMRGPVAQFAEVGDKLYHVWTCTGGENMRILVKSCTVSDGSSEMFTIIDDRG